MRSKNIGGTANATPSATNYATINGASNTVTMTQTGDNNLGQYDIKGSNNAYNAATLANAANSRGRFLRGSRVPTVKT